MTTCGYYSYRSVFSQIWRGQIVIELLIFFGWILRHVMKTYVLTMWDRNELLPSNMAEN